MSKQPPGVVGWCDGPGVNFQCRGVILVWIGVGQGPTALAVGAGGGLFGHFYSHLSFLFSFSSLWETTRYRLKYCLKGSLSPKTTNQTTPTRTYYKRSRPLPYCNPNCRTPRRWKFTQHHRTTRPPPMKLRKP